MPFNFLKDYSLEIKPEYIKTQLIEDLRLRDTVIVVNFNNSWIVIPLLSLTYYPFLYFYNALASFFFHIFLFSSGISLHSFPIILLISVTSAFGFSDFTFSLLL